MKIDKRFILFIKKYLKTAIIIPVVTIPLIFWVSINFSTGFSTVLQFKMHYSVIDKPKLYNVITERTVTDTRNNFTNYEKITCNDLNFKSPWVGLKTTNSDPNSRMSYFEYSDNKYIIVMDRTGPFIIRSLFDSFIPQYKYKVIDYFGQETVNSDFQLTKSMISKDPREIKFFMSNEDLAFHIGLIMLKDYYLPDEATNGIFAFETGNFTGIQYGVPGKDNRVILELYMNQHHRYSIAIYSSSLTQDEIDFILYTLEYRYGG